MNFFQRIRRIPWLWVFLSAALSASVILMIDSVLYRALFSMDSFADSEYGAAAIVGSDLLHLVLYTPIFAFCAGALVVFCFAVLSVYLFPTTRIKGDTIVALILTVLLLFMGETQLGLLQFLEETSFLDAYLLSFPLILGGALTAGSRYF